VTSTERVELNPAFVLHARAYRETSEIVEAFTRDHGRVSLVARGMRRPRSGLRPLLQPFQPLLVSWSGRGGGLMTLSSAEAGGAPVPMQGIPLMSGFYVNELVLRFLHKGDPHPRLFAGYTEALLRLSGGEPPERVLRRFEMGLLAEAGYGLILDHDALTGEPVDPQRHYQYVIERGPVPVQTAMEAEAGYLGAELLAIARCEFADGREAQSARRLLRAVLDHYLGGKPLRTREVFAAMRR
jgi:DNA repair protein RecO (recombination protein O)